MGPRRPTGGPALTLRIERIAAGGDGVGRLDDGRVVFVPRTAPGDLVEIERRRDYRRHSQARVARLIEPGDGRVEPKCPHYVADDCGGCQLQHLDLPTQLSAKRSMIEEALSRLGRVEAPVDEVEPAPDPWAYRARITLALAPGRRHAGFHPVGQASRVFPLEECAIAQPGVMAIYRALSPHLHLLPSTARRVTLRRDREGGSHILVGDEGTAAWSRGAALAAAVGERLPECSVWWQPATGAARVMGGRGDRFPATVFEQVHPAMGDRIRRVAVEALGDVAGRHVWDLYAGIGEATAMLIERGGTVESVELDRRAVDLAERRGGLVSAGSRPEPGAATTVQRHAGRVEEVLRHLRPAEVAIANPPRAGLDAEAVAALCERPPRRLVYVSCDPATLARDLGRLAGTYRPERVRPFDLFPQTAHVESVTVLERR